MSEEEILEPCTLSGALSIFKELVPVFKMFVVDFESIEKALEQAQRANENNGEDYAVDNILKEVNSMFKTETDRLEKVAGLLLDTKEYFELGIVKDGSRPAPE